MDNAEIALKSAGPPGSRYVDSLPRGGMGFVVVRFTNFMLARPEPADVADDVRAGTAGLEEPGERVPYQQVRRQLGLE